MSMKLRDYEMICALDSGDMQRVLAIMSNALGAELPPITDIKHCLEEVADREVRIFADDKVCIWVEGLGFCKQPTPTGPDKWAAVWGKKK